MQTMEANSTVLSKIFEAKYLLLSWRSDRVKNQDDHRFENSLAHAQLHTCTHAHAQLRTCTCTVTHLHLHSYTLAHLHRYSQGGRGTKIYVYLP